MQAAKKGNIHLMRKLLRWEIITIYWYDADNNLDNHGRQGADPNTQDNAGWSPLNEACNHGNEVPYHHHSPKIAWKRQVPCKCPRGEGSIKRINIRLGRVGTELKWIMVYGTHPLIWSDLILSDLILFPFEIKITIRWLQGCCWSVELRWTCKGCTRRLRCMMRPGTDISRSVLMLLMIKMGTRWHCIRTHNYIITFLGVNDIE